MMHPPTMIAELMLGSVGEAKARIQLRIKTLMSRRACKAGCCGDRVAGLDAAGEPVASGGRMLLTSASGRGRRKRRRCRERCPSHDP
jgi:hypothetical protein